MKNLTGRETASKLNPFISTIERCPCETLDNVSKAISDLGYYVSVADELGIMPANRMAYLFAGVLAAALDYEAKQMEKVRDHE